MGLHLDSIALSRGNARCFLVIYLYRNRYDIDRAYTFAKSNRSTESVSLSVVFRGCPLALATAEKRDESGRDIRDVILT